MCSQLALRHNEYLLKELLHRSSLAEVRNQADHSIRPDKNQCATPQISTKDTIDFLTIYSQEIP